MRLLKLLQIRILDDDNNNNKNENSNKSNIKKNRIE